MELKKAIETIHAMCEESKLCKDCPLFIVGQGALCNVVEFSSDEISVLEQKLIQWENRLANI